MAPAALTHKVGGSAAASPLKGTRRQPICSKSSPPHPSDPPYVITLAPLKWSMKDTVVRHMGWHINLLYVTCQFSGWFTFQPHICSLRCLLLERGVYFCAGMCVCVCLLNVEMRLPNFFFFLEKDVFICMYVDGCVCMHPWSPEAGRGHWLPWD